LALAIALAAVPLVGRPQQNHLVVTKTLVANSAHKECVSLTERQVLRYWYRADGALDFDLQHVEKGELQHPVRQSGQSIGTGSFAPPAAGDYCMVWTNLSKRPVLFRFEIARLAR
jgi:hypothetical protein